MAEETDETLMLAVREGAVESLGRLFDRYHTRIHALCYRLTSSSDAADDLVQETFLRALRYRATFRADSAFATWLYRLACNVCHDHWQRTRRADRDAAAARSDAEDSPRESAAPDDRVDLLEAALARLSPDRREVLVLTRYHDMSYDQAARVLDCTPAAARVRAHRALNELREIYRALESKHAMR